MTREELAEEMGIDPKSLYCQGCGLDPLDCVCGFTEEDFETETIGDKIPFDIGTTLAFLFVAMMILTILALITIIGVELGSAIWGDENVIYWISNLF